MAVYKFRTFGDAQRALWNFYPDQAYFKQVADLWDTADKLCPVTYPQGIFRFKTIDEANKQRKEWEIAHAKTICSKRGNSL